MQAEHIARYVRLGDRDALYPQAIWAYRTRTRKNCSRCWMIRRARRPAGNVRAAGARPAANEQRRSFLRRVPERAAPDDLPGFGSFAEAGNPTVGNSAHRRCTRISVRSHRSRRLSARHGVIAGARLRAGGAVYADRGAPQTSLESWRDLCRVPQPQFRIAADDTTTTLWFAFSAPVEVGRLSVLSDALVNRLRTDAHVWIPLVGGLLSLLFLVGAWREPPTSPLDGN
jgi:hypothetical protein